MRNAEPIRRAQLGRQRALLLEHAHAAEPRPYRAVDHQPHRHAVRSRHAFEPPPVLVIAHAAHVGRGRGRCGFFSGEHPLAHAHRVQPRAACEVLHPFRRRQLFETKRCDLWSYCDFSNYIVLC